MWTYLMPLYCTLKKGYDGKFYVKCIYHNKNFKKIFGKGIHRSHQTAKESVAQDKIKKAALNE